MAPMPWKGVFYVTRDTGPSLALQSIERWSSNLSSKYYFLSLERDIKLVYDRHCIENARKIKLSTIVQGV